MATKKRGKKSKAKTVAARRPAPQKPTAKKLAAKRSAPKKAAAKKAAPRSGAKATGKPALARLSPGKLKMTIMTGKYEIVRALLDGTVQPKGIELVPFSYPGSRDIHTRVATGEGADINEFNGGQYCIVKEKGRDIIGIPVFLHRRFRHGFIFINKHAGIRSPKDLIGKRIGMNSYGPAAHYWMRGHLEHDYGVPHRSMTYVIERPEDVAPLAPPPADLKFELLPKGKDVEQMLLDGELDVIMAPGVPKAVAERDPRVGHLWENYVDIEKDYYRRTGIFPIMHITTVPMATVAKHPWVVESLTHAFEEAKQLAFKRMANPRIVPLAWFRSDWEDERHLLGRDPWEYGLSEINKQNYDLLARFVHEQGMTRRRMTLEDLFAKEAFELDLPLPLKHPVEYDF